MEVQKQGKIIVEYTIDEYLEFVEMVKELNCFRAQKVREEIEAGKRDIIEAMGVDSENYLKRVN